MKDDLSYPFGYRWFHAAGVSVIGAAWLGESYLQGEALASRFSEVHDRTAFESLLRQLDGPFAVVLDRTGLHAAATDRLRTFPVLWRYQDTGFYVVSDPSWQPDFQLLPDMAIVFRSLWCTPGNRTLVDGLFQLEAGHYLWQDAGEQPVYAAYYRHRQPVKFAGEPMEARATARQHFERMIDRAVHALNGRPAVVPLSGGYDSRLLLTLLAGRKYRPLTAYTYGHPDGHEARLAERTARQLGVEWHFVPYGKEVFEAFFTEDWQAYSAGNHFFSSLPHEQDFFALWQGSRSGWLPEGFVAVPGFCGDLLAGSVTAFSGGPYTAKGLEDRLRRQYGLPDGIDLALRADAGLAGSDAWYDTYQDWFVRHKVSKFIVNSVRVYEYFGGDWILPFWDHGLTDFWYGLPYAWRHRQRAYNQWVFEDFFEPAGVAFRKPAFDSNYPNRLREAIKQVTPGFMTDVVRRLRREPQRDVNSLSWLARMICEREGWDGEGAFPEINRVHARFFLQNLNKHAD